MEIEEGRRGTWRRCNGIASLPEVLVRFVAENPQGVSLHEIWQHIYGDDPNGGPLHWRGGIHTTINLINRKLRPTDLVIRRWIHRSSFSPFNLRRISTGNIWLPYMREEETSARFFQRLQVPTLQPNRQLRGAVRAGDQQQMGRR